jgi:hypothetical protein
MNEQRIECCQSIKFGIARTGQWRSRIAPEYSDQRNAAAAARLAELAADPAELSDDEWSQLEPHYEFASGRWRDAISQVARQCEFRIQMKDMESFVKALATVLQS